jgi:hypothetical protein
MVIPRLDRGIPVSEMVIPRLDRGIPKWLVW